MGKLSYALEPGGPKRLTIDTNFGWRNSIVKFDGVEIGRIADLGTLKKGVDFTLPDGSALHMQYVFKYNTISIKITRNGIDLPGSQIDPHSTVKGASNILYIIGGFSILLGFLSSASDLSQEYGGSWLSILLGLVLLLLGFLTRRGSKTALIIAIILFSLDTVSTFIYLIEVGGNSVSILIARLILLVPMVMGVGAFNQIKDLQQATPPSMK
jgi:hypothetical protein